MENDILLKNVENYATEILETQLPPNSVFRDLKYTRKVVDAVQTIGTNEKLSIEEIELVQIAAWFRNTGYSDTYLGYEEVSKSIAADFLSKENVSVEKTNQILECILGAEGNKPIQRIAQVLVDAEQAAFLEGNYKVTLDRLGQEFFAIKKVEQSKVEGVQNFLDTILKYEFHTTYGKEVLVPARDKVKTKLENRLNKLQKVVDESLSSELGVTSAQLKAMKKKLLKVEGRPERGIETMFRLTSQNHIKLSGIADSKANIMISINSIIISVVLGSLMQKLDTDEHLIIPTIILLAVNLGALIFAVLSLRPNISDGLFTREDIENQKTNLLFFGNFHKMKRADYHWGMNRLMEDANFLYSNLIDDIYFLGLVLARKYKLLRTSYTVFLFGMVVVVIAFVISLLFAGAN